MTELTTMSSKGQIVVPKNLREELNIHTGSNFVIFGKEDTIILKKVDVPTEKEVFAKIHGWGVKKARTKGWEEKNLMKKIHQGRGIKSA